MESIKDRVAIVGMGCTKFGELWDKSQEDLMIEACSEAFDDARVEAKDIQAAWLGTAFAGLLGFRLAEALKLEYIPVSRVESLCSTGTDAFRNACLAVASGVYDMVLVCGLEKLKDEGVRGRGQGFEPYERSQSQANRVLPPPALFARAAIRYFYSYGLGIEKGKEILAKISVKNHHNGALNPKAQFQREITLEQAINAPMIAYPLGLYDACGVTDGCAAAILCRPDIAKSLRNDYVLVKGLGFSTGAFQGLRQTDFDFLRFEENVVASRMAYTDAGIKNPRTEIDVAMVHDCFTINELRIYEDLGFSTPGRGWEDVEAGTFTLEGELAVNSDGGLKSFGHPLGASGVRMIYEVYKQLQGKAERRQLKKVDIGLTHTAGGFPGCFSTGVTVLGRAG